MSTSEENHVIETLRLLSKKKGAWGVLAILCSVPVVIGALVAVVSYNFALVSYVNKINFAAQNAPTLAIAVKAQNANIAAIRSAVQQVHDTLNYAGYAFPAIPELIPIPDVK